MIRKLLAAACLLAMPVTAWASDWRVVSVDEEFGALFLVDAGSIVMDRAPGPQARMLLVLAKDQEGMAAIETLIAYDCATGRKRSLSLKAWDAAGKTAGIEPGEDNWREVPSGSNFAHTGTAICGGGKEMGAPIAGELPIEASRKYLADRPPAAKPAQ